MPKLDPSSDEFRAAGHRLIDWIADYLDQIDRHGVLARVQPGEIAAQFRNAPSRQGRPYDALIEEFDSKILPGVTHWNHPAFFADFALTDRRPEFWRNCSPPRSTPTACSGKLRRRSPSWRR